MNIIANMLGYMIYDKCIKEWLLLCNRYELFAAFALDKWFMHLTDSCNYYTFYLDRDQRYNV